MGFTKEDLENYSPKKRNGKLCFGTNRKAFNTDSIGRVSVFGFYAGMSSKMFFDKLCALTYSKTYIFNRYYNAEEITAFLEKKNFLYEKSDKTFSIIINDCFDIECLGYFHIHFLYGLEKGCLDAILIFRNTDSEETTNTLYSNFVRFFKDSLSKTNLGKEIWWNESEHDDDFFAFNTFNSIVCNRQSYSIECSYKELLIVFSYDFRDCFSFNQKYLKLVELLNTQEQDLVSSRNEMSNIKEERIIINTERKKVERERRRSKRFFYLGITMICVSLLLIGFSLGVLTNASGNASLEADEMKSEITSKVYVSDSPGSKRYHKDRNCQALKRSTGHITATDEANAIDQGKTLCGWCGK